MDIKERPLEGNYSLEKYVTLKGKKFQNELKLLGCFGTDLEEAKRREVSQKEGTSTSRGDNLRHSDEDSITILTLHEAFFLTHAFGCLTILDKDGLNMKSIDCWNKFKKFNNKFPEEYTVYYHFRTRGWVVKDGSNYGVTFLLYKRGPSLDHAHYAVIICDENQTWQSLLTFHRVIQSVKKELLLVYLSPNSILKDDSFKPDNMKELNITTRIFKAKPNFIPKINPESQLEI